MGLGLHGGGFSSAKFFARRGAEVTVTDLRDEQTLKPSIEKLERNITPGTIRYVLGRHEERDFTGADIVIKSPAVAKDSAYLQNAALIETDISVFLRINNRPVIAVTGSKGKSTTSAATAHILEEEYPETRLGGNITVSPLEFLEQSSFTAPSNKRIPVVLELSSWQLGDLEGKKLLKPEIALLTNILFDHMNHYDSMEAYVRDKALLFADQTGDDIAILNAGDSYTHYFSKRTKATVHYFSTGKPNRQVKTAWLDENGHGYYRFRKHNQQH